MIVVDAPADVRSALRERGGGRIGFVPTMGALHDGHLSLVSEARRDCDLVVLSIFVNPLQFDDAGDLDAYPRTLERDLDLAREAGVDVVYAPRPDAMYPSGFSTVVHVGGVTSEALEGASRGPAHFDGMATVVMKLLMTVQPDRLYLGQKDAQQVAVVRRMVTDLDIPVEVIPIPTSREPNGLARSSRNVRLGPAQRELAASIPAALDAARRAAAAGASEVDELLTAAGAVLDAKGIAQDYLAIVDPDTFEPLDRLERPGLLAVAARIGPVRLIDNTLLTPSPRPHSGAEAQTPPAQNSGDDRV